MATVGPSRLVGPCVSASDPAPPSSLVDAHGSARFPPATCSELLMSVKTLLLTAGIALVVVVGYEKSKGKIPGVKFGN